MSDSPAKTSDKKSRILTRGQKWRRRIIIGLSIFIVGVTLVRLLVPILLPVVMRSVAGRYGMNAEYDKLEFYMLGGDVGLWNLRFTPKDGQGQILQVDYCRGSVSTLGLLRGRINVSRAEAEGADVFVSREADGSVPLIERFLSAPTNSLQPAVTTETNIPLESPLTIKALRLQHATAHLADRAVVPSTSLQFMLNMILTDVGSPDAPTRYSIQVNSPEMLGALYLDGEGTSRNKQVNASLSARMFGLNPVAAKPYLAMLGISPVNAEMNATATGKITITPARTNTNDPPDAPVKALSVKVDLTNIELTNQAQPAASIKTISLDAPVVSPGEIRIDSININQVTASAWRDADGRIGFAGLSIGADSVPASSPSTQPAASPRSTFALPVIVLKSLNIKQVEPSFTDWALMPRVTQRLKLDEISITDVSTDPADKDKVARISIKGTSPNNIQSLALDGTVALGTPVKKIDATINVEGMDGAGLDPYFNRLGITRAMHGASLHCEFHADLESLQDGSLSIGAKASNIRFSDTNSDWFVSPGVTIDRFKIDPAGGKFAVQSIDIVGPQFDIKRSGKGEVTALGLTFDPNSPIEGIGPINFGSKAPTTQPGIQSAMKLPAIAIERFHWGGVRVGYEDTYSVPKVSAGLDDVDVLVTNFTIDPDRKSSDPGHLNIRAKFDGILDQFTLTGTLHPTGNSIAIESSGKASGFTLEQLKPFLLTLGIEPQLNDGLITFTSTASLRQEPETLYADLVVNDLSYTDGDQKYFRNKLFGVNGVSLTRDKLSIDTITIDEPQLNLHRDAEGLLSAMGLRLVTPSGGKPKKFSDQPIIPSRVDLSLPISIAVKSVKLNQAQIDFADQAVRPRTELNTTINGEIGQLALGVDQFPASYSVDIRSPGLMEKLSIAGSMQLSPESQRLSGKIEGRGISGNAFQGYLPPSVIPSTSNGTVTTHFSAAIDHEPVGGSIVMLSANDFSYNDGLTDVPAIHLKEAAIAINRFDLDQKLIDIDNVTVSGLSSRLLQDDRGFVIPGLVVGAVTNFERAPEIKSAEPQAASGDAPNLADVLKQANAKSPLVKIRNLSLGADRLAIQLKGMTEPIALADAKIQNTSPIELLGEDPVRRPPFDIVTTASVPKFVESIKLNTRLAPFAAEPTAKMVADISGINGKSLTTVIPSLEQYLDGNTLESGRFHSEIDSQFAFTRRGMLGIDLTRDITSNFSIKNTIYSQGTEDKPFASIQEIKAEKARLSPMNSSVAVGSIEIVKPQAILLRDSGGIHVMGLTIKDPSQITNATTQPAEAAPDTQSPTTEPIVIQAGESSLEQKSGGDFKIDTLTVSGIDLLIEDRVGTPVTILPITDLDAEIKGINTRALSEPLPIRFNVLVGAGKIPLPARKSKSEAETEDREIFSQLTATGKLNVYPKPDGYVKMSMSGFDLQAARGIAQQMGITLGGGTFDFAADVRMQGADTFDAKLYPTFTDLKVSEPNNGPIQRFLQLPAPLDLGIAAVQDADGSISLPVRIPIKAGEVNVGAIVGSAVGAVGAQMAAAIVSAPLKIAQLGGGLLGIETAKDSDLQPMIFNFASGESQPTVDQIKQISSLIKRLRTEKNLQLQLVHNLAGGDQALAEQRANPSSEAAGEIAMQLRSRKLDLQKQSLELSSVLKVALASQDKSLTDQTLSQLQQVSSQIAQNEQSLDDTLNLLRPGADKQADRRTKAASIELGKARLDAIKYLLRDPNIVDFDTRISSQKSLPTVAEGLSEGNVTIILTRAAKK